MSWYRDYAAYCGVTGNGDKLMAVVAEIGVRKPLYRKELGKASGGDLPDSDCAATTVGPSAGAGDISAQDGREVHRERERHDSPMKPSIIRREE